MKPTPSAIRRLFRHSSTIVVRLARHGEAIAPGETLYPLDHCHHGRWRSGHAVRAVRARCGSTAAIVALAGMLTSAHANAPTPSEHLSIVRDSLGSDILNAFFCGGLFAVFALLLMTVGVDRVITYCQSKQVKEGREEQN